MGSSNWWIVQVMVLKVLSLETYQAGLILTASSDGSDSSSSKNKRVKDVKSQNAKVLVHLNSSSHF